MPEYAVFVVGAIYPALPRNVVVGPIWLLPTVIVVNREECRQFRVPDMRSN